MKEKVKIGDRWIGPGEPTFIVVETGTTCNGDLDTALRMVDSAVDAEADAIKFMIIGPDEFMSDKNVVYEYETSAGRRSENMYEMFKGLMFTPEQWRTIADHCHAQNITFYATVDYPAGVELAEELNVAAYKLSSWDARHFPLIRRMAATGKPVEIDLGPAFLKDIETMLDTIKGEGNEAAILVHCTHAETDEEMNLRSVPYLQQVFGCPVGYSADSRDFVPDLGAIALGAHLVEKRLTLNKDHEGHHHIKALEPDEFRDWVKMIRQLEAMLGRSTVEPSAEDLRQRELHFVSLVADADIPAGTKIASDMIAAKRPGSGIDPALAEVFVGRRATRDIKENELLSWDMI